jgi:hypothetical protein
MFFIILIKVTLIYNNIETFVRAGGIFIVAHTPLGLFLPSLTSNVGLCVFGLDGIIELK